MSKILEENWIPGTVTQFWRRCVESVTGWLRSYRDDTFLRTEINVIALQVAFALVIIALIAVSFTLLYRNISFAIIEGIRASIASPEPASLGPAIVSEVEHIRTLNLVIIISIVVVTTTVFGYIIARITLRPARNALESQKQFIGNIAHELRTPLSTIKTSTEVALLDTSIPDSLKETFTSTIEELDRISQIINNLLSLSILVHPEEMKFTPVDMSTLVTSVIENYAALTESNKIEVTARTGSDMYAWGNATALEQIVGNIFKNAISFTPRGGRIRVTIDRTLYSDIELTIQDSGVGIARKDLYHIFEPFYRAEQSRTRIRKDSRARVGGSGLGLTIVSELIKAHHGRIIVRSTLRRGTTVSIILPSPRANSTTQLHPVPDEAAGEIAMDFSREAA